MNEALQSIKTSIEKLISKDSVTNCSRARFIVQDSFKNNIISSYYAMCLCALIVHAICGMREEDEIVSSEIELGNLRMLEQYSLVGRTWRDHENDTKELLNCLDGFSAEQADDYVAHISEILISLPGHLTRMSLFLSLQVELALVISRYRVDSSLNPELSKQDAWAAELAYTIELALFEALFYETGSELWKSMPEKDAPEDIRDTLTGWQSIFDGQISSAQKRHEDKTVAGERYQYRSIRPGRVALLNDNIAVDHSEEYVVPAWVDGKRICRVEHIPDIHCDVLRFEEGIEEVALTNFRGECRRLILPDSLISLKARSFSGIQSLIQVTMNGAVIEDGAFANCSNLESVSFGPKLWSILSGAFKNCVKLKNIAFHSKVYTIGEDAFRNCTIEALTLPEIDCFYQGSFGHCTNLRRIRFTGDIATVYGIPFSECPNIQSIDIDEGISSLEIIDGALYQVTVKVRHLQPHGLHHVPRVAAGLALHQDAPIRPGAHAQRSRAIIMRRALAQVFPV